MIRQANILDPIHDSLPSDVWDTPEADAPRLKPQHRKWITTTVVSALTAHGYTHVERWLSLVLTGSLTTYQYSPESDCDISLFVDAEHFPEWSRAEMIGVMVSSVDGTKLPGTTYPLQCFVVDTKVLSKADLYKAGLRSGYDLETDTWVEPPDRSRAHDVAKEDAALYAYAMECADKMERLLRYEPDKAVDYWHQLHRKRRKDQLAGKGDYAPSNVIYKFLDKRGLFKEISEASGEYIAKVAVNMPDSIKVLVAAQGMRDEKRDRANGRAFWFDDDNGVLYLSRPGGVHTDVLNAFRLPYGGMWRGVVSPSGVEWIGARGVFTPEETQAVADAISPYLDPDEQYATSEPAPAEDTWDFTGA